MRRPVLVILRSCMILSLVLVIGTSHAAGPRGRGGLIARAADALIFRPPPSVVNGVETPASRMARYEQLRMRGPDESTGPSAGYLFSGVGNTPGVSIPILPGAGPDPALRPAQRSRVLQRYTAWRARRGLPATVPPQP
jgi:hypothetical protein